MDSFVVRGGAPLRGAVQVGGSKNAALPVIFATLLGETPSTVTGVPDLRDIRTAELLLREMGVTCAHRGGEFAVDPSTIRSQTAPYELVRTMRASVLALGPLLSRHGRADIYMPGGCVIGARPIDMHIAGLEAMGARVEVREGFVQARASRLAGCDYTFRVPTVTGTGNLMMAACLARGTTLLRNAAIEPEILDLAKFLSAMGADISWPEPRTVRVDGVGSLQGATHRVCADRIVAGTLMAAVTAAGGSVELQGATPAACASVTACLRKAGADIRHGDPGQAGPIAVTMEGRPAPVDVETAPHPGFPTDMQAQLMAACCLAGGTSTIRENIFEGRFMHVPELQRMGADIRLSGNTAIVTGQPKLTGAHVMATDIRASACLVIAGLAAEGTTQIDRVYHLDRGYEALEERFRELGGDVTRVAA